jgi:hypothetical protein
MWQGQRVDHMVDEQHAEVQNWVGGFLAAHGWDVAVEVSFNHFGDRGRIDVLAFHASTRSLAHRGGEVPD